MLLPETVGMSRKNALLPVPPKRTRLPAAQRRAQILTVATDLFLAEGIESTSMRRIAEMVGVTPTAIYDHFRDKEALLTAIAGGFFKGLADALAEAADQTGDDRIGAMLRAYVQFGLSHPHEYRLVFMPNGRPSESGLPPMAAGLKPAFDRLQQEVTSQIEAGVLRRLPEEGMARSLWAMAHGIVSLGLSGGGNAPEMTAWQEAAIDIMLRGALLPHLAKS